MIGYSALFCLVFASVINIVIVKAVLFLQALMTIYVHSDYEIV